MTVRVVERGEVHHTERDRARVRGIDAGYDRSMSRTDGRSGRRRTGRAEAQSGSVLNQNGSRKCATGR